MTVDQRHDTHDFDRSILDHTAHRPWPMPARPWVMTQTWNDLLFAHWPVHAAALSSLVPPEFPIDLFGGQAWLGIVPFHMTNVAPRGFPALPWISAFPELNVRTYVRVGEKPGVYFFSLDAANPVAVRAARVLLCLPYYTATMTVAIRDTMVDYSSRRAASAGGAEIEGRYAPTGPSLNPTRHTLEYFLTERYCLYARHHSGRPYRLDIHHPPWPLQPAEADLARNTMAEAAGIALPADRPLLHFAKRQDMVAWPPAWL